MSKLFITALILFAPLTTLAEGEGRCQSLVEPRPLGLNVPSAKAELERLRFLPPAPLSSPRELHETFRKLVPPGHFEVLLNSEHRIGEGSTSLADHPTIDRAHFSWGGPALDVQDIALRATLASGTRSVVKIELPKHEKTRLDVSFSQNRYHASFTSLKSTLVLQYDTDARLVKIFAFRGETSNPDGRPARGTYYQILVPAT